MKRFIRTVAGKTILFILCIAFTCILTASVLGIIFFANDEFTIYARNEQEYVDETLKNMRLRSYGFTVLNSLIYGYNSAHQDYEYRITDQTGYILAQTELFDKSEGNTYTLSFKVRRERDNRITESYYYGENIANSLYGLGTIEYCNVTLKPVKGSSAERVINLLSTVLSIVYKLRYYAYLIGLAALLGMIVCFVALMSASGHRPDTEEIVPGPLCKVPFDLILGICVLIGLLLIILVDNAPGWFEILGGITVVFLGINVLLGLCMSTAVRIKMGTLFKNTVIYRVIKLIYRGLCGIWTLLKKLHRFNASLIQGLPLIWKTGLIACGISLVELIVMVAVISDGDAESLVAFWLFEKIILIPAVLYLALMLRRLQKSGTALADGNLDYVTDTKGLVGDFKRHGETLNRIADGMTVAVDERMRSERMKTELITNVSHDIKTPLTSIINYAGLIGSETCENPKIAEYSDVLVRQSEKLKRLIEDLVEASKAATGNLEVELAPCEASILITQIGGEYEERLSNAELSLITLKPQKELNIMADGRRMWRIFDNLMSNICKYSLPGTRVYISLEEQNNNAVITLKNTSKDPLNMSAEEFTERFTRGDSSRNTEGNGLGLSIAKSLTELQGGNFRLTIDGDLFKVTLSFPLI